MFKIATAGPVLPAVRNFSSDALQLNLDFIYEQSLLGFAVSGVGTIFQFTTPPQRGDMVSCTIQISGELSGSMNLTGTFISDVYFPVHVEGTLNENPFSGFAEMSFNNGTVFLAQVDDAIISFDNPFPTLPSVVKPWVAPLPMTVHLTYGSITPPPQNIPHGQIFPIIRGIVQWQPLSNVDIFRLVIITGFPPRTDWTGSLAGTILLKTNSSQTDSTLILSRTTVDKNGRVTGGLDPTSTFFDSTRFPTDVTGFFNSQQLILTFSTPLTDVPRDAMMPLLLLPDFTLDPTNLIYTPTPPVTLTAPSNHAIIVDIVPQVNIVNEATGNQTNQMSSFYSSCVFGVSINEPFTHIWEHPLLPQPGDTISGTIQVLLDKQVWSVTFSGTLDSSYMTGALVSLGCSAILAGTALYGQVQVRFSTDVTGANYVSVGSFSSNPIVAPSAPKLETVNVYPVAPLTMPISTPLPFQITITVTKPDNTKNSQIWNVQDVGTSAVQNSGCNCAGFGYNVSQQAETITLQFPLSSQPNAGALTGNITIADTTNGLNSNLVLKETTIGAGGTVTGALDPASTFFGSLRTNASVTGFVNTCSPGPQGGAVPTMFLTITSPLVPSAIPMDAVWPTIATNVSINVNLTFTTSG